MITKDELEELIRNQGRSCALCLYQRRKRAIQNQIGETCSIYHVA